MSSLYLRNSIPRLASYVLRLAQLTHCDAESRPKSRGVSSCVGHILLCHFIIHFNNMIDLVVRNFCSGCGPEKTA